MDKILTYLKNPTAIIVVLASLLILLLIFNIKSCSSEKEASKLLNQNISALKDSLRYEKNKVGELTTIATAFVLEKSELEKTNKQLFIELKKAKEDVKIITLTEVVFKEVPVKISNNLELKDDGFLSINWKYNKDTLGFYQYLETESTIKIDTSDNILSVYDYGTIIKENSMYLKLVSTIRYNEKTELYESTITSTYPKVRFNVVTNIDPSVTEYKKEDDFVIGPMIGVVGLSGNWSTNNPTNSGLSWYIGLGITYKIIGF